MGGTAKLYVQFPQDWPWGEINWQDLWTVVQWQDVQGDWHDVDGWQGGLDEISESTGQKTWWFSKTLAGQGPFRWLVYRNPGGKLLAESESFYLPSYANEARRIKVLIEP